MQKTSLGVAVLSDNSKIMIVFSTEYRILITTCMN